MEKPQRNTLKLALIVTLAIIVVVGTSLAIWIYTLDREISKRFAEKRFAPPVEFYSAPETITAGSIIQPTYFTAILEREHFRRRDFGQALQDGDYSAWTPEQCRSLIPGLNSTLVTCLAFRGVTPQQGKSPDVSLLAFDGQGLILGTWYGSPLQVAPSVTLDPELFAQYYGDKPTLRQVVPLGDAPANCLQALLAIEDSHFLEHSGVSVPGLFRAFFRNLRSGKVEQGGSTITQQLVKNYFLTQERTLKRKIKELFMAILVENHASKDDILETYINLIYLGQNGPFEIRGFGAAAEHYFGANLRDLTLPQCALMTAMIASPGQFNPVQHPDKALKRRGLVLDRMLALSWISADDAREARATPLPIPPQRSLTEPAPYFVQAVRKDLLDRKVDTADGLRVFTTLNLRAQEAAHLAVREGLDRIESTYKQIKKIKATGKNLEAVLISADPATGDIQAVVGGRSFNATQFNRAIDSHRQVGSIMKPLVYLTALDARTPDGAPYTPVTMLKDAAFTHTYQGQSWSPKNYDNEYFGTVPMFFALKESLNAATASLGLSIGLDSIIDTARRVGITSHLQAFPALTLGAFELYPTEVLQAYSTLAQLGRYTPLSLIRELQDPSGHTTWLRDVKSETRVDGATASELVGMMKQTLLNGTARSATLSGFTHPAAGKTGTTNDKKDAWFSGFTPYHVAIVWVGYDDNTSHGLTGASGAVPIWTQYMKAYGASFPAADFAWAPGTEVRDFSLDQIKEWGIPPRVDQPIHLVFKK
jgi:penicillin-binding protein 1B